MTSRAFRKLERIAQAETTEDPAQKEDADADLSGQEEESELPQRGNVFAALLAEDGLDEDEDEEDKGSDKEDNAPQRKIPATPPQSGAGKKKRGKKKGPSRTDDTSESVKIDDDEDIDAILAELRLKEEAGEKDVKGKKKDLGGKGKSPVSAAYRLLSVDPKNLDADAEMKRMFGAIVLQQEQAPAAGRGRGGRSTAKVNKRTLLAAHKDTWPRMTKLGLDMQSLGQDSQGTINDYINIPSLKLLKNRMQFIYIHTLQILLGRPDSIPNGYQHARPTGPLESLAHVPIPH